MRRYQGSFCLLGVDALLAGRLGVDEPTQLARRLRLGHERDDDAEHDVDDERRGGGDERRSLAAERDDAEAEGPERVLGEEGDEDRRQRAGRPGRPSPAVAVIRFQNMPRMKVAKSGALKKPNSVWR